MGLSERIVEYICSFDPKDIPEAVINEKKKNILDTLGVMVAGSKAPGCDVVVDEIIDWGGRKDASIVGRRRRVPLHNAAIANCMMARALDYDDVFSEAIIHINASSVPVAFLVSERLGNIDGKTFLSAMTLASDIAARMGIASLVPSNISGFSFTFQFASIIAAIVTGRLLGLNSGQMRNALGIAYSQMAGNNQAYVDGAMTIRLQQGLSASAGVLSAVLAMKGITGARDIFDGRFGYYNIFSAGKYDVDVLLKDLGTEFYGVKNTIKPYPCCTHLHGAVDGILELRASEDIRPETVEKIVIRVNQSAYNICCIPVEIKRRPQSIVDLQFSYNYVVAAALFDGKLDLDSFEESVFQRKQIFDFGESKIFVEVFDEKMSCNDKSITQTEMDVFLNNDDVLKKRIPFASGSKENPMSMERCKTKFIECINKGNPDISKENIVNAVEMIESFETIDDVDKLYKLLIL